MPYTIQDVGPRMVKGRAVELTQAEKQAIVDEWNANEQAGPEPTPRDLAAEVDALDARLRAGGL